MHTIRLVAGYAFLALAAYIVAVFAMQWRKAVPQSTGDGTGFWNRNPILQRIVMTAHGSVTILWGNFAALLACLVGGIGQIGDMFGDPNVKGYAETILQPKIVAGIGLAFAVITIISRKRTL